MGIPNRKYFSVKRRRGEAPVSQTPLENPENPLNPEGSGGGALPHNSTTGKQGGDPVNDFYGHVTEEQIDKIDALPSGFITKHSELNLDDGTNPHETTATDVGLGSFEGLTPETLPISDATQDALDLKADKDELFSGSYEDLTDLPIQEYPFSMNWLFDGTNKDITIPAEYYLSRVENIRFIDIDLPRDNISYVPKPLENKIKLGALWTPSINTKLYLDLWVLKDL